MLRMTPLPKSVGQEFVIRLLAGWRKLQEFVLGSRTELLHNSYKGAFCNNSTPKRAAQLPGRVRTEVGARSHEPPRQICSVLHIRCGGRGISYSRPDRLLGRVSSALANNLQRFWFLVRPRERGSSGMQRPVAYALILSASGSEWQMPNDPLSA